MSDKRLQQFVVTTPFPGATTVVCYQDTWTNKLVQRVPASSPTIVQETLQAPTAVVIGTTNPGYVAFVSNNHLSPGASSPFVVLVDPQGNPLPAVASVGHRRDFKDLQQHTVLWPPASIPPAAKK